MCTPNFGIWDAWEAGALVHYTLADRIFVAGAQARNRRKDHLIDEGSITAVVSWRVRFKAANTVGTAIGTSAVDGDGSMRHGLQ